MLIYTIFVVCVVGTNDCKNVYAEMPRPPEITVEMISDEEMLGVCTEHTKQDHTFDKPVSNPQGIKVKITPSHCVLSEKPPANAEPANAFAGYYE